MGAPPPDLAVLGTTHVERPQPTSGQPMWRSIGSGDASDQTDALWRQTPTLPAQPCPSPMTRTGDRTPLSPPRSNSCPERRTEAPRGEPSSASALRQLTAPRPRLRRFHSDTACRQLSARPRSLEHATALLGPRRVMPTRGMVSVVECGRTRRQPPECQPWRHYPPPVQQWEPLSSPPGTDWYEAECHGSGVWPDHWVRTTEFDSLPSPTERPGVANTSSDSGFSDRLG
jgi:hypothetical protein